MVSGDVKMVFNQLYNMVLFKIFPTVTGKGFRANGRINRRGRGNVIIGNYVTINSSKKSNILGGNDFSTIYARKDAKVLIGNNVGISNSCIIAFDEIKIGDNVLIGADCKIYDTDFHSLDHTLRGNLEADVPKCKSIKIEDYAFIGAHSIILKGVTIGKCSIVGAGSVVTHDIPEHEIWAGNPAKYIRKC